MRLNKYIALYSDLSRRKADEAIEEGRVAVNRSPAVQGMKVDDEDRVFLDKKLLIAVAKKPSIILLHKPIGYVCSKDGQGSPTVYDLLSKGMQNLNVAGRLDKDSSGLVVMTDDGQLMQELTHPTNDKEKIYIVELSTPLADGMVAKLANGVDISDSRLSKLIVIPQPAPNTYHVSIQEGRNRQIRRSFEALGYHVVSLHRTQLGPYEIENLVPKQFRVIQ